MKIKAPIHINNENELKIFLIKNYNPIPLNILKDLCNDVISIKGEFLYKIILSKGVRDIVESRMNQINKKWFFKYDCELYLRQTILKQIKKENLKIKYQCKFYNFLLNDNISDLRIFDCETKIYIKPSRRGMKDGINRGLNWYNHLNLKLNDKEIEYKESFKVNELSLGDIVEEFGEGEKELGFDGSSKFYDLYRKYQVVGIEHEYLYGNVFKCICDQSF